MRDNCPINITGLGLAYLSYLVSSIFTGFTIRGKDKKIGNIEMDMEMHDKLIIATALYFKAPLITKDERIKEAGKCSTIW